MRRLAKALGLLVALAFAALALGTLVPRPLFPAPGAEAGGSHRVLLLSNPIHTDFAVPLDAATAQHFGFLAEAGVPLAMAEGGYLIFGWGGRSFYIETPTWADLKPMPVVNALTLDRSVMHVELSGGIDLSHPAVRPLDLGAAEYDALLGFIEASFSRADGRVQIVPDAGYGDYDFFFEAEGGFNALAGCNTWTARALRIAGLRTGWWNPLPQSLGLSLDLYN